MKSSEIRQKYLDFFKARRHAVLPSASLIPENDSSTLFISSGMQPLAPYLLGENHPQGVRLTNSQKSFRTEDIEEVGDNRHNTFFEMLGNWSLGDYFKKEQLPWIFEFLTKELSLDPSRLYVTVFRGNDEIGIEADSESVEIWEGIYAIADIEAKIVNFAEKNGLQGGRIFYYDEKKNWWSRSGIPAKMPIGEPGGPDSEIFYDLGEYLLRHEHSPYADKPCHVNCDCGRFIEIGNSVFMEYIRMAKGFEKLPQRNVDFGGGLERITMVTEKKDSIFETDLFINTISKIEYLSQKKYRDNMQAFEIIADHLKAACFIIGDDKGITPANTGQGYVVRRLLRRAIRYGRLLGISESLWIKEIAKIIAHDYATIYPELAKNINRIIDCLKDEQSKFDKTLEKGLKYIDLITQPLANDSNQDSGQTADSPETAITGEQIFNLYQTHGFPIEIVFEELSKRGINYNKNILMEEFDRSMNEHQELSRTASAGMFKGGLADSSLKTKKLHTAAHLLLASLRKILGNQISQKGSNITAERLRFDFSYGEKLTPEQLLRTEALVNQAIKNNLPVQVDEMPLDDARTKGAMGVFESKYGAIVKVYTIGEQNNIFSMEICGGPHVERTGILGVFKIVKEESSSAGVRRIKAVLEKVN